MSHQKRNNITYLDELIDLDDDSSDIPNPNQYQKFIRNYAQIAPESGMGVTPHNYNYNIHSQELVNNSKENNFKENNSKENNNDYNTPNCLDIHAHIIKCPICSKFFKFDNTVYIIAIVVLSIVCILLLKRILNV